MARILLCCNFVMTTMLLCCGNCASAEKEVKHDLNLIRAASSIKCKVSWFGLNSFGELTSFDSTRELVNRTSIFDVRHASESLVDFDKASVPYSLFTTASDNRISKLSNLYGLFVLVDKEQFDYRQIESSSKLRMLVIEGLGKTKIQEKTLASVLAHRSLFCLQLSGLSFVDIVKFEFPEIDNIKHLQIRSCNNMNEVMLAKLLKKFTSLSTLSIVDCQLATGVIASIPSSLYSLKIKLCSFERSSMQFDDITAKKNLRKVLFEKIDLSNREIKAISSLPNLSELILRCNFVEDIDAASLFQHTALQKLSLVHSNLDKPDLQIDILVDIESISPSISILSLDHCRIDDKLLKLVSSSSVDYLDLSHTTVSNKTLDHFLGSFRGFVWFGGNEDANKMLNEKYSKLIPVFPFEHYWRLVE